VNIGATVDFPIEGHSQEEEEQQQLRAGLYSEIIPMQAVLSLPLHVRPEFGNPVDQNPLIP